MSRERKLGFEWEMVGYFVEWKNGLLPQLGPLGWQFPHPKGEACMHSSAICSSRVGGSCASVASTCMLWGDPSVKGGEMVCWLDGGENECGVEGVGGDGKGI